MLPKGYAGIFYEKLIYSLKVVVIYIFCSGIPIAWVKYPDGTESMDTALQVLYSTTSATGNGVSLLALGFGPWITAGILMQIITSMMGSVTAAARRHTRRISEAITLLIALFQAKQLSQRVVCLEEGADTWWRMVTILTLITGMYLIIWLGRRNTEHGIGGMSLLIFIQILRNFLRSKFGGEQGLVTSIMGGDHPVGMWMFVAAYFLVVTLILIELLKAQVRLPVKRVMIDSTRAEESYLAIRLNPAGAMSVMFAAAFFDFFRDVVDAVARALPGWRGLQWLTQHDSLNSGWGVGIFLLIQFLLSLFFTRVMINPREMADSLRRAGDYLLNLRPGQHTERHIRSVVNRCARFSAVVLCVCVAIPLGYHWLSGSSTPLYIAIMSWMIMISILLRLFEESEMLFRFRDYNIILRERGFGRRS